MFFLACWWTVPLCAQSSASREVENVQMLGIGHISTLDTYLSPEEYTGAELRFISQSARLNTGKRFTTYLTHHGSIAMTEDRSGDGSQMSGLYTLNLSRRHDWHLADDRWLLQAGWMGDLNLGFLYDSRNSNNPAQARFSLQLGPSLAAHYHTHLGKAKLNFRYEVSVPLVGIMFSPNYGQSYYEIFSLGHYDHNAVVTTIVSAPSLRQMLTVDFRLWRTTWRVGYLGDYQQAEVNNLKQHFYTHSLLIGFVRHFTITDIIP
ncbi:MAG: DUF3316 domain-containing protein [Prevotella sp.]|nr:DUF3316 domain-containing protein [Prevotella sp.]